MDPTNEEEIHPKFQAIKTERWNALKKESTISLFQRIVRDSDALALRVFHETRTLFYRDGKWVRLTEFLRALKDASVRGPDEEEPGQFYMNEISDDVYDLTLAKFHNIPSERDKTLSPAKTSPDDDRFTWQVDCRLYFKQVLKKFDEKLNQPITSEVDIEEKIAKITTKFVIKHFYLSMKECRRRAKKCIRYTWEVKGRTLELFYPRYLTARQFLDWLEKNVIDVDPDDPKEKNRIQELIDQTFPRIYIVSVDYPEISEEFGIEEDYPSDQRDRQQFIDGLGIYMATEKSENFEKLRPGIRSLGKEGVFNLVNRIFSDLADEQYVLSKVARHFGLSKATLSRFAGSDWSKSIYQKSKEKIPALKAEKDRLSADQPGSMETAKNAESEGVKDIEQKSKIEIPDLWANTAHVLAEHPLFKETLKNTQYAGIIATVLQILDPQKGLQDG